MTSYSRGYNAAQWGIGSGAELVFPEISLDLPELEPLVPAAPAAPAAPAVPTAPALSPQVKPAGTDAARWQIAGLSPAEPAENQFVVRRPDDLTTALQAQMDRRIERTGTALVNMGLITQAQLDTVLAQRGPESMARIGERLVRAGFLTPEALQHGMLRRMAYPVVDLASYPTDTEVLRCLPYQKALDFNTLPLARHGQQLVVVMADPSCAAHLQELKFMTQRRILPALLWQGSLAVHIKSIYAKHKLGGSDDRWFG